MYVWAGEAGLEREGVERGRGWRKGDGNGIYSILQGYSWNFNCTHEGGDEYS
jgi:hypothetical protein